MSDNSIEDRIKNRDSWLKVVVVLCVLCIVGWKVIITPFSFESIGVSDILTLVVSLFAVGLSVAFYLKATETSNTFYDNTYKFTKDVSEMLGRIEAGFGERLRHLDEGYSGLIGRFDQIPFNFKKAEEKIVLEERKLKESEEEKKKIIEALTVRAKMQEEERKNILDELELKERNIKSLTRDLNHLRNQVAHAEVSSPLSGRQAIPDGVATHLISLLGGPENVLAMSNQELREHFSALHSQIPLPISEYLASRGLLGPLGLSGSGAAFIKAMASSMSWPGFKPKNRHEK
jgi:hypothetical protein